MVKDPNFAWLKRDEIKQLVSILGADKVRFVGGAVRDSLLGRPVHDIDAATSLHPMEVKKALEEQGVKVNPTGIKHGTVTALINSQPIEITTLRHDKNPDGRHADVEFVMDWREDAKRRDFTMNALYLDIHENLYDYYGGETDCRQGRVKFIGNASQRIEEDALRIYRFFRFHSYYGKGDCDPDGLKAISAKASLVENLSVERIWSEWKKILSSPHVIDVLGLMDQCGLLPKGVMLPEDDEHLNGLVELESYLKCRQPFRILSLLMKGPDEATAFAKRYKLSLKERTNLLSCYGNVIKMEAEIEKIEILKLLYLHGRQQVENKALLSQANHHHPICGSFLRHYKWLMNAVIPTLPVTGRDLMANGFEKGPQIGEKLKELEAYWLAHNFNPTKQHLLALL